MLRKITSPSVFYTIVFILLNSNTGIFTQEASVCKSSLMILKTAERFHYKPKPIDDNFSQVIFTSFIENIDPYGMYFSKENIDYLKKYETGLDEAILNQDCNFLVQIVRIFRQNLMFSDSLINTFKTKDFTFKNKESLIINKDDPYLSSSEVIKRWEKIIKYRILDSYITNTKQNNYNEIPDDNIIRLRDGIINQESCRIQSILNYAGGLENYLSIQFLKAVSTAFDPHSEYFTKEEEEGFNGMLSKEVFSFGIEISKNDLGEIEISQIVPGSPAWNSNSLNEGDIILKVKIGENEIEFNCISQSEVTSLLSSSEVKEAQFSIRKQNGKEMKLDLPKEKINVEDNVIKSFILDGKNKIGYIYLPSFYSQIDDNDNFPNGCANDVAKELIKLNKEEISGLVLDLRDNGGGSMLEALRMAGIFIDYGALCIFHHKDETPYSVKDLDRGTVYDAPMVVLVNTFSASASELFAAAMQDYNRAILVGSKTFGKSTAQEIIPIDAYKYNLDDYKGNTTEYIKLTQGAFYRVTGQSHQKEGIIPDIILPDVYDELNIHERSFESALKLDPIDKKAYYYPLQPLPIDELNKLSKERIQSDTAFTAIILKSQSLFKEQERFNIPLDLEGFIEYSNLLSIENLGIRKQSLFVTTNPSYYKGISSITDPEKEINENIMLQIQEDIYITEAYNIINDLINLNKK
ncbi:MAG: carboxy terminal-processing peptidase [Bacteroidales bacterium]|nr:carboxy terminal-processing peptidase [Bacteroidales bacterium]